MSGARGEITERRCISIRKEYVEKDVPPEELAERYGVGRGNIYTHVTGHCKHSHNTAPAGDFWDEGNVTKDECAGFRWRYKHGLSTPEIADGSRWGMSIICHHVFGKDKCSHSLPDEPPAEKNGEYQVPHRRQREKP